MLHRRIKRYIRNHHYVKGLLVSMLSLLMVLGCFGLTHSVMAKHYHRTNLQYDGLKTILQQFHQNPLSIKDNYMTKTGDWKNDQITAKGFGGGVSKGPFGVVDGKNSDDRTLINPSAPASDYWDVGGPIWLGDNNGSRPTYVRRGIVWRGPHGRKSHFMTAPFGYPVLPNGRHYVTGPLGSDMKGFAEFHGNLAYHELAVKNHLII